GIYRPSPAGHAGGPKGSRKAATGRYHQPLIPPAVGCAGPAVGARFGRIPRLEMPRVLIGASTLRTTGGPFRDILESAGFEVVWPAVVGRQMTEDELLGELANGVDATLAGSETYTRRVLDVRRQLKVIARNGVGYDAVDVAAATDHGVPV